MAGIAANLLEADRIIVPESGQGALGPWLKPVGSESPDVRSHPFFTASLSRFLELVFGRRIEHEHPQLWTTKGETLRELTAARLDNDWWMTKSCPRGRKVCVNNKLVQCGVCSSCLLRRQSLFAAGIVEDKESYLWANLSAPSLSEAAQFGARSTSTNDQRQAMCGTYDLATLGNLLRDDDERIANASAEFAAQRGESVEEVATSIRRLLTMHQEEWRTFVAAQGCESFLNRWQEAVTC
jgi:hypothetical protein